MGWGLLYVDFSRLSVDCFVVKVLVGMPWKVAMVEVLGKVKVSGCGGDFSFFIPMLAFNFYYHSILVISFIYSYYLSALIIFLFYKHISLSEFVFIMFYGFMFFYIHSIYFILCIFMFLVRKCQKLS